MLKPVKPVTSLRYHRGYVAVESCCNYSDIAIKATSHLDELALQEFLYFYNKKIFNRRFVEEMYLLAFKSELQPILKETTVIRSGDRIDWVMRQLLSYGFPIKDESITFDNIGDMEVVPIKDYVGAWELTAYIYETYIRSSLRVRTNPMHWDILLGMNRLLPKIYTLLDLCQ